MQQPGPSDATTATCCDVPYSLQTRLEGPAGEELEFQTCASCEGIRPDQATAYVEFCQRHDLCPRCGDELLPELNAPSYRDKRCIACSATYGFGRVMLSPLLEACPTCGPQSHESVQGTSATEGVASWKLLLLRVCLRCHCHVASRDCSTVARRFRVSVAYASCELCREPSLVRHPDGGRSVSCRACGFVDSADLCGIEASRLAGVACECSVRSWRQETARSSSGFSVSFMYCHGCRRVHPGCVRLLELRDVPPPAYAAGSCAHCKKRFEPGKGTRCGSHSRCLDCEDPCPIHQEPPRRGVAAGPSPAQQKACALKAEEAAKKQLEQAMKSATEARRRAELQSFIAAEHTAVAAQQQAIAEQRTRSAQRLAQTVAQTEMARRHALEQRLSELESRTGAASTAPATAQAVCVVCLEAPKVIAFQPCGHVVTCNDCATRLLGGVCPICRKPIASLLRVFV
jgi:hypothetical protein